MSAEFTGQEDSPSPFLCSQPAYNPGAPECPLLSLIDFTGESGTAELVWTFSMNKTSDGYHTSGRFDLDDPAGRMLAVDVVSPKAVRNFEVFGEGLHLFWEGNPKALYEFKDGEKRPVDTYASFEHDSRYSDNIVENAYVDELANFFAVLKGEETPRWSFEQDRAAIAIMDRVQAQG